MRGSATERVRQTTMTIPARPYRKSRSDARAAKHIERARELRRTLTETEEAAWFLLRRLRRRGFKFRRQHPVGPYTADFCCPQHRLVVELDGGVHGRRDQAKKDAHRDAYLRSLGYTTLRVPNGMVLEAPDLFVAKVLDAAWLSPDASRT